MKRILIISILLCGIILAGCTNNKSITERDNFGQNNNDRNITTCTFSLGTIIKSEEENNFHKIKSELTKQTQPLKITFVGLDTETPTMKGTVDTVNVDKIIDNGDYITLAEKTIDSIRLYTYFPKEQIMIYSIQEKSIVGDTYGEQLMGFCY